MKRLLAIVLISGGFLGCESDSSFSYNCDVTLFVVAASGTLDGAPVCFRNSNSGLGFTEGSNTLNIGLRDGILLSDGSSILDLEAYFSVPSGQIELNQRYNLAGGDYGGIRAFQGWIEITEDNNQPSLPATPYLYGGMFDLTFQSPESAEKINIIADFRFEPRL